MRWNGSTWAQVPSPSMPGHTRLEAVSAVSACDATAVGWFRVGTSDSLTFVLHWDGFAWCIVPSPNVVGASLNDLYATASLTPESVWAAGSFIDAVPQWNSLTLTTLPTAVPAPSIGNHLLAVRRSDDVSLDWSASPLPSRDYNVHREDAKQRLAPPASAAIGSATVERYLGHQFCRDGSLEEYIAYDGCECTSATQQRACTSPDACQGVQWCILQPFPVLGEWGPCQAVDDDTECLVQSEVRECIVLEGLSGCPGTQTCDACQWSPCEP